MRVRRLHNNLPQLRFYPASLVAGLRSGFLSELNVDVSVFMLCQGGTESGKQGALVCLIQCLASGKADALSPSGYTNKSFAGSFGQLI